MSITTIESLLKPVRDAGRTALREQKKGALERDYKPDGSVITRVDQEVEDFLHAKIAAAFPRANILSEETRRSFDDGKVDTFVVDPIDGTDAFSQGMPGWCISAGLMRDFVPVAGIIYSPAMDLFLFADVDRKASLNGRPMAHSFLPGQILPHTNLVVSSSLHQQLELGKFPGKIRSLGSAALHLCFPLVYPGLFAAVESRNTHIWDILAAHAIVRSHGLVLEYLAGGALRYRDLTDGRTVGDPILAGYPANIEALRMVFASRS